MTVQTGPEAPWDFHSKPGPLSRKATHRFPAATYLHRNVAREERAFAREVLDATDRSANRRIGGLAVVVLGLIAALLFVVATGRTTSSVEILAAFALGGAIVVAVAGIVAVLRRHERDQERLADRVRAYETRLLELRSQRQRLA